MKDFDLTRESVLAQAVKDCYREMFAKAQPAADWDNLIEEYKAGKIDEDKDGPVYERHYLSYHEYVYIIDKYIEAYKIKSDWNDHIDILKKYLVEGGLKNKYIEAYTDKNGNYHTGYRSYEDVPQLKNLIADYIRSNMIEKGESEKNIQNWAKSITDIVMNDISTCKNYYLFNVDESKFRNTLALGATPTPNAETVKKWWKEHYNVDIEIKERNPLLLWEYDNYGDQIDEIMTDEYGEDWEQIWWDKWHKEQAEKKAKIKENSKK